MIIKDLLPIHIVKKEGFLKLIQYFSPNYKLPSEKTLRDMISEEKDKLKTYLISKVKSKYLIAPIVLIYGNREAKITIWL